MVPIITNGNRNIDEFELMNLIIDTCKNHRETGRALAFAFIVYDFDDYTIPEILNNKSYWNSLDKISGKTLSVFYINSQDGYYNRRQREIYEDGQRRMTINAQKGVMSYFVPITLKATPIDNAISTLKKEFEIEGNIKTPFILFFQVNDELDISDSFIVELKQEKLEDAFIELQNHIKKAVNSLNKVSPEYYANHQEIFNLIKNNVSEGQFYTFIKRQIKNNLTLETIIKMVRCFFVGI